MKRGSDNNELEEYVFKKIYKYAKVKECETIKELRKDTMELSEEITRLHQKINLICEQIAEHNLEVLECDGDKCVNTIIISDYGGEQHARDHGWRLCEMEICPMFCGECDASNEYDKDVDDTCKECQIK